jgi:hypothetical protein
MRQSSTTVILMVSVVLVGFVNSGCFVVTCERRNKPVAPCEAVQVNSNSEDVKYSRRFQRPDLNVAVGAENGPARWQLDFWFYVLPIPERFDYLSRIPLWIDVQIEPKSSEIAFEPMKVYFQGMGTNQVKVPPSNVWQDQDWLGTNVSDAVSITNRTRFRLEFMEWSQMCPDKNSPILEVQPNRDLPFRVAVEGVLDSGRRVDLPSITFRPTAHIEPGFRLPY